MGIPADIYKAAAFKNSGVISKDCEEVTIVNIDGPFEPSAKAPAVLIVPGNTMGTVKAVAAIMDMPDMWVPMVGSDAEGGVFPGAVGPMFGGCYVATSDSRFTALIEQLLAQGDPGIVKHHFYGAVALHDRYETQAQYDALSQ